MGKTLVNIENELINELFRQSLDCGEPDVSRCAEEAHRRLALNLIYTYLAERGVRDVDRIVPEYFITDGQAPTAMPFLFAEEIPELCEQLHVTYINSGFREKDGVVKRVVSKENMVARGAVYTQKDVVENIVRNTLRNVKLTSDVRLLDFACGTGRFYCEMIKSLVSEGVEPRVAVCECVHANDIDPVAVNIARLKACSFLDEIKEADLIRIASNVLCENALTTSQSPDLFSSKEQPMQYDAIVSNPPYLVLKPSHNTPHALAEDMRRQVSYYRTSGLYKYSIEGMLNLYQLSVERMLGMLKENGEMGVICPSTLFADKSSCKLRKHLLLKNKVRHISYFPENELLFENNVTQATNIFHLRKGGTTEEIEMTANGNCFKVSLNDIKSLFPDNMEIPLVSDMDWRILKKLSKFQKLKSIKHIRNKRGELDLTLDASYITTKPTGHRLVRGKMVSPEGMKKGGTEYVSEDFVGKKSDDYRRFDYGRARLAGQNICNIDNRQRLRFAYCEPSDILGNSCNYLSSDILTLRRLHILLSSSLLNWRFKVTSSNNHINNYELDELPIVELDAIDAERTFASQPEKDEYVCTLYGLDAEETRYICDR